MPDHAAFRIDFDEWLAGLSHRDRQMIEQLAAGERPSDVAKQLRITPAAVSQRREKWCGSWNKLMGELLAA